MREVFIENSQQTIIFEELVKPRYQCNNLSSVFSKLKFSGNKVISVELCPTRRLDTKELVKLSPEFCSVTWHSPSNNGLSEIPKVPAISLSKQLSMRGNHVLLHLVGRHLKKSQVVDILAEVRRINVRNILVLQGDPSHEAEDKFEFEYASDLIKFIKQLYGNYFCIGVAAYPEIHPLSLNKADDLKYLKMKVDAGADFIITQMFFSIETFNRFFTECKQIGINIPIIPGVAVITSYKILIQMTTLCKVHILKDIKNVLKDNIKNPEAARNFCIFKYSQLVKQLLLTDDNQVTGVHLFTLNNIKLVRKICKVLGLCDVTIERPLGVTFDNLYASPKNCRN